MPFTVSGCEDTQRNKTRPLPLGRDQSGEEIHSFEVSCGLITCSSQCYFVSQIQHHHSGVINMTSLVTPAVGWNWKVPRAREERMSSDMSLTRRGREASVKPAWVLGGVGPFSFPGVCSSRQTSEDGKPSSSESGTRGARWNGTGPGATGQSRPGALPGPPLTVPGRAGRLPRAGVRGAVCLQVPPGSSPGPYPASGCLTSALGPPCRQTGFSRTILFNFLVIVYVSE